MSLHGFAVYYLAPVSNEDFGAVLVEILRHPRRKCRQVSLDKRGEFLEAFDGKGHISKGNRFLIVNVVDLFDTPEPFAEDGVDAHLTGYYVDRLGTNLKDKKDDRVERSRYGGVVLTRFSTKKLGYARVGSNPTADVFPITPLWLSWFRAIH